MSEQPEPSADERRRRVERRLPPPVAAPGGRDAASSLAASMAHFRLPGCSVAVIHAGRLNWAAGYGVVEAARPTPVTPDTLFQACSISKPVAAVAALRLVQDGRLDLDEDVNASLTAWRVPANGAWQPRVTLRQLLTHSAGLTQCWYPGYAPGAPLPTLLQTLRGEPPANTPPVRVVAIPGTQYRYSGSHYSALQQVLVDVAGQPFPALARALVFAPLGMRHSGYEPDFPARHAGTTAAGHDAAGVPLAGRWRVTPEAAGAGLWTTPADLARLLLDVQAAWRGEPARLLSRETARRMLTPHAGDRGLGWVVMGEGDRRQFGHGGDNIGYKCALTAFTDAGRGAVVMTNGDEGQAVADGVLRAIAAVYGWPPRVGEEPAAPAGADAAALDPALAGAYRLATGALLTLEVAPGGALLRAEGQPAIPLRAVAARRFVADVVDAEVSVAPAAAGAGPTLTLRQRGDEVTATSLR
jgi:CubicO group peptidase (beta-lactamase class C family)